MTRPALKSGCVAILALLTGCQDTPTQPVTALVSQALPLGTTFPKYLTLGQPTRITLGWTPLSPQVRVSGRLLPATVSGNVLTFSVPAPKPAADGTLAGGGWGGPQSLSVTDGARQASGTVYVLGRSYLYNNAPGGVLFLLGPGRSPAELSTALQGAGIPVTLTRSTPLGGPGPCQGTLVEGLSAGISFEAVLEQLDDAAAMNPGLILGVNPRTTGSVGEDSVPMNATREISVSAAQSRGYTGKGAIIAVLDTGIAQNSDGLAQFNLAGAPVTTSRLLPGRQFTPAAEQDSTLAGVTRDDYTVGGVIQGHGTQVASLAAGNTYGVAYSASVLPVKVCDKSGRCRVSDVIRGVCSALNQANSLGRLGNLVLNLSLGGDTGDFERDILKVILSGAIDLGVPVAASAGNDWDDYQNVPIYEPRNYPAALNLGGLLGVGAVQKLKSDPTRLRTSLYSDRGPWVDILAPGTSVLAVNPYGLRTDTNRGTSFATPQVAGGLALWRQKLPQARPAELQAQLVSAADTTRVVTTGMDAELDPYKLNRLLSFLSSP